MSATYKVIGERWLRKYAASDSTPVDNALADVTYIASHMCEVPWTSAARIRDARTTWHTEEVVHTEGEEPTVKSWTGLDWNVMIRDQFDAALFCSHHKGGGHIANANAAVYVYKLPDSAVGKTLQSLTGTVTSDPYNKYGVRIALVTNTNGVIPKACKQCREGGIYNGSGYTESSTFHTPTDENGKGVAPRLETVVSAGTSIKSNTASFTVNPASFVLQKYLMVFVTMENYGFCRGNWIEGSSFLENGVSITLNEMVDGWSTDETQDLTSSAGREFAVSGALSNAVNPNGSLVCMYEASESGHMFPDRKLVVTDGTGHLVSNFPYPRVESSETADGRAGSVSVNALPIYCSLKWRTTAGVVSAQIMRRVYSVFHPSFGDASTTGFLPGVRLYYSKFDPDNSLAKLNVDEDEAAVSLATVVFPGGSDGDKTETPGYQMLVDGTAKFVFVGFANRCSLYLKSDWTVPGASESPDMMVMLSPVYVGGESGVYIVGFVAMQYYVLNQTYPAGGSADLIKFYFSDAKLGSTDLSGGLSTVVSMYPGVLVAGEIAVTLNETAGTVSMADSGIASLKSRATMFHCEELEDGVLIQAGSQAAGRVACYGENITVTPCGSKTGFYSSFVVTGKLQSVGDVACSKFALVKLSGQGDDAEVINIDDILADHTFNGDVTGVSYFYESNGGSRLIVSGGFTTVDGTSGFSGKCMLPLQGGDAETVSFSIPANEAVSVYASPPSSGVYVVLTSTPPSLKEVYAPTKYDSMLLQADPIAASLGLRNCYANLFSGNRASLTRLKTVEGAAFNVVLGTKSVVTSADGGTTLLTKNFPVWRILTSQLIVPTSFPIDFEAKVLRLAWTSVSGTVVTGAKVNVWMCLGDRPYDIDEAAKDHRLFDATESEVGVWKLIGSFSPGSDTYRDIDLPVEARTALTGAFLFTAWMTQDDFNPNASMALPRGIGTLTANGSGVVSGFGYGWKPTLTLLP